MQIDNATPEGYGIEWKDCLGWVIFQQQGDKRKALRNAYNAPIGYITRDQSERYAQAHKELGLRYDQVVPNWKG